MFQIELNWNLDLYFKMRNYKIIQLEILFN